jgi:hypothetical protein
MSRSAAKRLWFNNALEQAVGTKVENRAVCD